jgi:hypothetical protein
MRFGVFQILSFSLRDFSAGLQWQDDRNRRIRRPQPRAPGCNDAACETGQEDRTVTAARAISDERTENKARCNHCHGRLKDGKGVHFNLNAVPRFQHARSCQQCGGQFVYLSPIFLSCLCGDGLPTNHWRSTLADRRDLRTGPATAGATWVVNLNPKPIVICP